MEEEDFFYIAVGPAFYGRPSGGSRSFHVQ